MLKECAPDCIVVAAYGKLLPKEVLDIPKYGCINIHASLLPEYRGRGIGHAFFDRREAHAQALGRFRWTAFCAVDRDAEDPRKPPEYRPNDAFWAGRGYARQPGMTMRLPWNEAGRGEIGHALTFWLRDWRGGVR